MDIHQHLLDRHFSEEEIIKSALIIDEQESITTFLMYNASGQLTGYQEYRPKASKEKNNIRGESRYWTYMVKGNVSYWGQHSLDRDKRVLFLTEGIMDAARLSSNGYQAIATLSNNPKHLRRLIDIWKATNRVIALCDNDKAGRALGKFAHECIVMESDVNDASEEELSDIFNTVGSF